MEHVRALLLEGKLPKLLWAECILHATTLINMTPSSTTNARTPYELWYNRTPSMQYIRVFGCSAYVHIPEHYRDKLDPRATLRMYLGVAAHKKGYRLLDLTTHTVVYSRDVEFDETTFPSLNRVTTPPSAPDFPLTTVPLPVPSVARPPSPPQPSTLDEMLQQDYTFVADSDPPQLPTKRVRFDDAALQSDTTTTDQSLTEPLLTDDDIQDHKDRMHIAHSLLAVRYIDEPATFKAAMRSSHATYWLLAAQAEFQSLTENETWTLVHPPRGRQILQNRWVFVVKYTTDGRIDRFKARLVIKGFLQQYGVYYDEIFSPVIRMEVLILLLTIAALLDYEVHQMDVKTAFLNGFLKEDIYMAQPEGFQVRGQEHLVCKLVNSLYGLKQAPRVWYETLSAFLLGLGFHKLIKDRCAFMRSTNNATCNVAVYVDDLLIIAPTISLVSEIKSALHSRFSMTDLGEAKHLLGWSIVRNRPKRTMFIHQHKYTTKVLHRFRDLISYPIATPSDPSTKLSTAMQPDSIEEQDAMRDVPYREAVGSVMYLMVGTRPDLAFYIQSVSQYLANPGQEHWKAVIRGLRYLAGTQELGIKLGGTCELTASSLADALTAYSDADYANCPDTRRSVGGDITMIAQAQYHGSLGSTTLLFCQLQKLSSLLFATVCRR
ncbi:TPA: hypothetical protein N0F65_002762 [Lagenidium giganteum]|uniref:Reverse transcriptase Ty1/copia-type domain-containing protein n=1 Tax=Lagenidium giganteum TaxID=4803 RepID=A0AAV2YMW9_9STRA|nr:TPA: hypothetical protein N0F65_002762 [Lagenidium giganteum]